MNSPHRIRVWDLPTRLFHWSLAGFVVAAFVTVKSGRLDWHFYCGYAILTLLLFRLIWGFVGGRYARFGSFLDGPRTIIRYLRGDAGLRARLGHSPLGGMSVWVMLGLLLFQAGTGLFANDDIASEGPLVRHISNALSSRLTSLHHANETFLLIFIGLHVLAIIAYLLIARRNLIGPMLGGDAAAMEQIAAQSSRDDTSLRLRALAILGLSTLAVAWLVA